MITGGPLKGYQIGTQRKTRTTRKGRRVVVVRPWWSLGGRGLMKDVFWHTQVGCNGTPLSLLNNEPDIGSFIESWLSNNRDFRKPVRVEIVKEFLKEGYVRAMQRGSWKERAEKRNRSIRSRSRRGGGETSERTMKRISFKEKVRKNQFIPIRTRFSLCKVYVTDEVWRNMGNGVRELVVN